MHRRSVFTFAIALALAATMSGTTVAGSGALPSKELQAVRAAVGVYHSYAVAQAAGYSIVDEPCVESPDGAMGYHAVNRTLTADLASDPLRPEIMLYEPRANGTLDLVGVEYFQIALANTADGPRPWFEPTPPPLGFATTTPSVLGHLFDGPMPGHNPAMPWHYDLHVWVFQDSPTGLFAAWNPTVSCDAAG
jgi:hypothetical protein